MISLDHDICELQPGDEATDASRIVASVLPDHTVWLVRHEVLPPEEAAYGEPLDTIELSADGWTTLVELYALRRPAAFARVAARVQTLRRATGEAVRA